jgi:hypothetical protein
VECDFSRSSKKGKGKGKGDRGFYADYDRIACELKSKKTSKSDSKSSKKSSKSSSSKKSSSDDGRREKQHFGDKRNMVFDERDALKRVKKSSKKSRRLFWMVEDDDSDDQEREIPTIMDVEIDPTAILESGIEPSSASASASFKWQHDPERIQEVKDAYLEATRHHQQSQDEDERPSI